MINIISIERTHQAGRPAAAYVFTGAWQSDVTASTIPLEITAGPRGPANPQVQIVISQSHDLSKWNNSLDQMRRLQEGWNGYSAPAPSGAAILTARSFLSNLLKEHYEPSRLAPSAVGGVGITHKKEKRKVYVEFYNKGEVCALFSDNESSPLSKRIEPGYNEFRALIEEIRDYLDA